MNLTNLLEILCQPVCNCLVLHRCDDETDLSFQYFIYIYFFFITIVIIIIFIIIIFFIFFFYFLLLFRSEWTGEDVSTECTCT